MRDRRRQPTPIRPEVVMRINDAASVFGSGQIGTGEIVEDSSRIAREASGDVAAMRQQLEAARDEWTSTINETRDGIATFGERLGTIEDHISRIQTSTASAGRTIDRRARQVGARLTLVIGILLIMVLVAMIVGLLSK